MTWTCSYCGWPNTMDMYACHHCGKRTRPANVKHIGKYQPRKK